MNATTGKVSEVIPTHSQEHRRFMKEPEKELNLTEMQWNNQGTDTVVK